jgi:hypothetical protein
MAASPPTPAVTDDDKFDRGVLLGVAFVVALALLPKAKPEPVDDPAADAGAVPAPALAG